MFHDMGLSVIKGNGGFLGTDERINNVGNFSVRKYFLQRKGGLIIPFGNVLFSDTFENGNLNKWTVVNGIQNNKWTASTVSPYSGSYSAIISNTNGTTLNYINTSSNVHMYFDFNIPTGAVNLTLSFYWKCGGENGSANNQYDFGYVQFVTTGTTPAAGTQYTTNRVGATTNLGKFNSTYSPSAASAFQLETIIINSGTTNWCTSCNRRIIFSWTNDSSVANQPPWDIDSVNLIYS